MELPPLRQREDDLALLAPFPCSVRVRQPLSVGLFLDQALRAIGQYVYNNVKLGISLNRPTFAKDTIERDDFL